jgi:hypothetical protein
MGAYPATCPTLDAYPGVNGVDLFWLTGNGRDRAHLLACLTTYARLCDRKRHISPPPFSADLNTEPAQTLGCRLSGCRVPPELGPVIAHHLLDLNGPALVGTTGERGPSNCTVTQFV